MSVTEAQFNAAGKLFEHVQEQLEEKAPKQAPPKPACTHCGGTEYNDVRSGLGDCCLASPPRS